MNGEFPSNNPRVELEARLTAFILGELPAHDAAALRQAMEEDVELAALYERLKAASKLVREAAASPVEQTKDAPAPLRLSEERRQKLLAAFKTVAPKEFVRPKPVITGRRLLEIAAVLVVLGILAGLSVPNYIRARLTAQSNAIRNNLRQIDGAKQQWALETHAPPDAVPAASDIMPYMGRGNNGLFPESVAGEKYEIGPVAQAPTAKIKGKRRISLDDEATPGVQTYTMAPQAEATSVATTPSKQSDSSSPIGSSFNGSTSAPMVLTAPVNRPSQTTIVLPSTDNFADASQPVAGNNSGVAGLAAAPQPGGGVQSGSEIREFPLKHADAKEMASLLGALFPGHANADDSIRSRGSFGRIGSPPASNREGGVAATADQHTGALTVSADKETMPQIAELVKQLDQDPRNVQHVTILNNAEVQDVLPVLQDLFPSNTSRNSTTATSSQNSPLYLRSQTLSSSFNSIAAPASGASGGSGGNAGIPMNYAKASDISAALASLGAKPEPQSGAVNATNSAGTAGDPEWTAFLEHPDQRHSGSNAFLSRGSFVALPQGDKLDLDYITNQAGIASSDTERNKLPNLGAGNGVIPAPQKPAIIVTADKTNPEFRFYHDLNADGTMDETDRLTAGADATKRENRAAGFNFETASLDGKGIQIGAASPTFSGTPDAGTGSNPLGHFPGSAPQSIKQGDVRLTGLTSILSEREELFVATPEQSDKKNADVTLPEVSTENGRAASTVPTVTGTYFGGINGTASSAYLPSPPAGGGASGKLGVTAAPAPILGDVPGLGHLFQAASSAQEQKNYRKAGEDYSRILAEDPGNSAALAAQRENKKLLDMQEATIPSQEMIDRIPARSANEVQTATMVQDGKLLFEAGKLDEAEVKLKQALREDPANIAASQYQTLIDEKKKADGIRAERHSAEALVQIENGWDVEGLNPHPNVGFLGQVTNYVNAGILTTNADDAWHGGTLLGPRAGFEFELADQTPADKGSNPSAWSLSGTRKPFYADNYDISGEIKKDASQHADVNLTLTTPPSQAAFVFDDAKIAELEAKDPSDVYSLSVVGYVNVPIGSNNIVANEISTSPDEAVRRQGGFGGVFGRVGSGSNDYTATNGVFNEVIGRIVSVDPESKRVFFVTDSGTAENASNGVIQIGRNGAPNPPNVVHYNRLRIEGEATYAELLKRLKGMDKEELKQTLTKEVPDTILNQLLRDEADSKERLTKLEKDLGPDHPEVKRTEKLVAEYDQEADRRAQGILKGIEINLNPVEEQANRNPTYLAKKQELDRLIAMRDAMATQAAEQAGVTPTVTVIAEADGNAANKTLRQRVGSALTGNATEMARIKIERDVADVPSGTYDPYFIQTEFEAIQSEKILDQAIERLKLNEVWGKKEGRSPLSTAETRALLKRRLQISPEPNSSVADIKVESNDPEEAAKIANTVAEVYADYRKQQRETLAEGGAKVFKDGLAQQDKKIAQAKAELAQLETHNPQADAPIAKPAAPAPIPQPEVMTGENAFSTFSLNIADVSFKLAAASLEKGQMPEPASIRSEEFINAFDYRDPEPAPGAPLGFAWERAQYPFAQNRDLLRFSVKTAAAGREAGRPMNIVLLLDKSGSMERADRVRIIHEALRVLATQLQPQDKISVVTFARVARLWVDGLPGSQAAEVVDGVDKLTPEGGTNLEEAMRLAYETARRHYLAGGINRVVLLTDGAANLGNVDPESLKQKVEEHRKEGIALDCFGIGWEGYNDDLLEVLSRNGGGRYGFLNTPEEAASDFAGQLAGALHVAASDVKVQVEFNPKRVTAYRQIGYAKHQLTKEQFRDNTVNAAQIGAAESGNALYAIEVNPNGEGPLATVRVRYKVPGTEDYPEHSWEVPYTGGAVSLEQASPAMRLAGSASAFSEWLATSPFAGEVTTDQLLGLMRGVPETYGADERPKKLEWMIRQAKSLTGK